MQRTPSSPQKATGERLDMPRKSELLCTLRRTVPVETDLEIDHVIIVERDLSSDLATLVV